MQAFERYIEDFTRCYIGRLIVHHIADVTQRYLFALFAGVLAYLFKVAFLIQPHHSRYYNYHRSCVLGLLEVFEPFLDIIFFKRFEQVARFAREDFVQGIKRQVNSVVGDAVLREVISSDFLAAVA